MEFIDNPQIQIIFQLLLAAFLGALVGLEREYKKKEAGLRTYSLVSLGAALFTIIAIQSSLALLGKPGVSLDPSRIIGQIVVGIGFIGAGLIIYRQFHIEGLTTAAGLWITAGIGIAVAFQFYWIAVFTTSLAIIILAGLQRLEEKFMEENEQKP